MSEIREHQETLNRFTNKYLKGVKPLRLDGEKGPATNSRILACKYYLGYGKDRNSKITSQFVRRLRHPRGTAYSPKGMVGTGIARRAAQKAEWARTQIGSYLVPGVTRWNGTPVAKCAVPYLDYAKSKGWAGYVVSGWRDPAYSQSLCYRICGAPSCPGKCAGTSSNHVGNSCSRFALDVSYYSDFGAHMRNMPLRSGLPRIFNGLGAQDPVHFSPSGR